MGTIGLSAAAFAAADPSCKAAPATPVTDAVGDYQATPMPFNDTGSDGMQPAIG